MNPWQAWLLMICNPEIACRLCVCVCVCVSNPSIQLALTSEDGFMVYLSAKLRVDVGNGNAFMAYSS